MENDLINGILGLAIGDAFGIPVENTSREALRQNPVTDWREFGAYPVKMGTWSDITASAMCVVDSLKNCGEVDYDDIMNRLGLWKAEVDYTAHEEVFRIDEQLAAALSRYASGTVAEKCGTGAGTLHEGDSCAALARMVPYAYYQEKKYGTYQMRELTEEEMTGVHELCTMTNAGTVTQVACGIYVSVARELLCGITPGRAAITNGLNNAFAYYDAREEYKEALNSFAMLRSMEVLMPDMAIRSGHSSAETVTAAVWCIMKTCDANSEQPYVDTVLRAVNLGDNAPAVAALAGGLAGILYGYDAIPEEWKETLARRVWIEDLCRSYTDGGGNSDLTVTEEQLSMT